MTNTQITITDTDNRSLVIATNVDELPSYEEARDNRTGSIRGNVARILAARTGVQTL